MLGNDDVVWLDNQCLSIRRLSGAVVTRSGFLRGVVRGLRLADLNFSRCCTEMGIARALADLVDTATGRVPAPQESLAYANKPEEEAERQGVPAQEPVANRRGVRRFGGHFR
jgi:hypothetical protein